MTGAAFSVVSPAAAVPTSPAASTVERDAKDFLKNNPEAKTTDLLAAMRARNYDTSDYDVLWKIASGKGELKNEIPNFITAVKKNGWDLAASALARAAAPHGNGGIPPSAVPGDVFEFAKAPVCKPKTHQLENLGALPAALARLTKERNWVCWKWVCKKDKWTKPPYRTTRAGGLAKNNDAATWGAFPEAVACVAEGSADGIGYMLRDSDHGAIDLDDCRNPATGEIAGWARAIIDRRPDAYVEVTVSGTGLRVIGTASGAKLHRKLGVPSGDGSFELYRKAERFITISGLALDGRDAHALPNIDALLDSLDAENDSKTSGKKRPTSTNANKEEELGPRLTSLLHIAGKGAYNSRSELLFAFLGGALRKGVHAETIVAACLDDTYRGRGIYEHCRENGGCKYVERQAAQAKEATNSDLTYGPKWRERNRGGRPSASLYNARLAITELGIECRYDLFHEKVLVGYRGGEAWHDVRQLVGELSDVALTCLRQKVSERFGFDPAAVHVHDAVKTLAFERCFDPVFDLLDAAQANWDKVPRLDKWVVTYLGCEDTELNRAIGRKVLIAAVRRARQPGCKFDNIIVLEGDEGLSKSTAIRVLAGDENFSDQRLLGARDKEVQELLAGVWMHENADLAGMRRADVEHVKAFASRQVDRARPAYGRVTEWRQRRSIEWGTTNSSEYLQSQTGNRRFWPLSVGRVLKIEELMRDRPHLLGEAATCEAKGESLVLDSALWPDAAEAQEMRRLKHPWEDVLADIPETLSVWSDAGGEHCVRIVHRDCDGREEKVASKDLLEHVLKLLPARQTRGDSMRLADAMRALGWQRTSNGRVSIGGRRVTGFWRGGAEV